MRINPPVDHNHFDDSANGNPKTGGKPNRGLYGVVGALWRDPDVELSEHDAWIPD